MGEAGAGAGAPGGPEASPEAEVVKLLPFLAPGARADLQAAAVRHVLALTGSGPGPGTVGEGSWLQPLTTPAPTLTPCTSLPMVAAA
uniref:Uncharacterized protein n=1 Tax=Rhinopithecus bieti TaxID=61621 RepID=A0A2K6MIP3_RHIBE